MVALMIFGLAAGALAPVLLTGARGALAGKMISTAKNLSSARINSMLALPFHVAWQNGGYLDLLDDYYAGVSTTAISVPATGGTGVYVPAGVVPGQSATSAFYQVRFGAPPEPAEFTQVVDTQFLVPNSSPRTALAPPTTGTVYSNSQLPGGAAFTDQPVSLLVGVTVLTSYTIGTRTHTYRTYTEITDTGHDSPLVVARAGVTALSISSNDPAGNALAGTIGQVGLTGSLSTTSAAVADAVAASFRSTDPTTGASTGITGATGSAVAPPDPAGSTGAGSPGSGQQTGAAAPCGWGEFGPTGTQDVSATVAGAQPRVPLDVESGASPVPTVQTTLAPTAAGGCPPVAFTNIRSAGGITTPAMDLPPSGPLLQVADPIGAGPVLTATANLDTPALTFSSGGSTQAPVTASASVTAAAPLQLFPSMPFATAATTPDGRPSGNALLVVDLTSAGISCTSGGSATANYTGTAYLWEQPDPSVAGGYATVPLSWSSGSPAPALPSPSTPVTYVTVNAVQQPVPLSTWIRSWQAGNLVQQTSSAAGLHTVPAALAITTAPTASGNDGTAITVDVDQLSCVAEDNR